MTPMQLYRQLIDTQQCKFNPQQEQVVFEFQHIYHAFVEAQQKRSYWFSKRPLIKGLYLWGSVGVGKTWLMDVFFQTLPTERKFRIHFHEFMDKIHQQLQKLQGHKDPLQAVAKDFASQFDIICFDEFLVDDIGDAMVLANLLEALFAEKITLVTTANTAPDFLYLNGLQRARFMPAIALLKQNLNIMELKNTSDYRLQGHEQMGAYYFPLTVENDQLMQQHFMQLAHDEVVVNTEIMIKERPIKCRFLANGLVWFEFAELCTIPRSQLDYLEISKRFPTVFLSDIPKISTIEDNKARYLINLIDIFYDLRIKLIISAAVHASEIYTEGALQRDFGRTQSRLLEMQSQEYLVHNFDKGKI